MYLHWYQRSKLEDILDKGLKHHPTSCMLWLEKIKLVDASEKESIFGRAIDNVGGSEQLGVWREYLKWAEDHLESKRIEPTKMHFC